jgi:penicillin G amidase
MRRRRALLGTVATLALAGLVAPSVIRIGPLPLVGPFLDPVHGVWALAAGAEPPGRERIAIPGLSGVVEVLVDDRGVPHTFAATEEDAYRVMGWLVARDRLFQLELTTRAGQGTLTELLGAAALESDRETRHLGLAWSAEREVAGWDTASVGYRAVVAYAQGVNAYIDALRTRDLPLEYRLLGRRPRRWQPVYSGYLFARMGLTLAAHDPAESRLTVQALVGEAAANALVPVNSAIQEPIQPSSRDAPRYDLRRLPPPGGPDTFAAEVASHESRIDSYHGFRPEALGSNNWAVAPGRAKEGHALLAGDPHLELTLPSIWYEAHVVVPGRLDVAGVSLAGSPGIVIGFNRDLAWSFTNTGGDVSDLYLETVDASGAPSRYLLDGEWRPLELRLEEYRDPDGRLLATDTVRCTHRGPLTRRGERWVSRRWTVLEPSQESDLFLQAARTRTADQWLDVMRDYVAPTQNGLVADRGGTIAIRSSGWYPVRPGDGRGDVVRDGSTRAADWTGVLPVEGYPFAKNPAQGLLASANQQPVDPLDNPAYLGADWPPPWRAIRINALLRADSAVTVGAMRRYQTDPGSARADAFVPHFLNAVDLSSEETEGRKDGSSEDGAIRAAALLREWDRKYGPENQHAILFELAMAELERRTWDELIPPGEERPGYAPSSATLLELLQDSTSVWWDDRRTGDVVETRDLILIASLGAALDTALARYGDPPGDGWTWSRLRTANIHHLLGLPGLSALGLAVTGGPSTLSPLGGRGTFGASWRMVVELGPEVRAWATYPGGQSGNPASPRYDDRIPEWTRGDLDRVLFPRVPGDLPADRVRARMTFVPGA